jgi:hypothetical protein
VRKQKKGTSKLMTRLPTKRMATACWAFIVVKRTPLETAPLLDFFRCSVPTAKNHPQVIHKALWMIWGQISDPSLLTHHARQAGQDGVNCICLTTQSRFGDCEVNDR